MVTFSISLALNSSTLLPSSSSLVSSIAAVLIAHPELRVRVEGHTDDTGTHAVNMALSQARADAVRAALVAAGVDAGHLVADGVGAARPLVDGKSDDARAQNRRVELVVVEAATSPASP